MRVHILSFCMKVSGEETYALELLDLILDASYEDIGEYNKLSHFWQIGTVQFLNQKLPDTGSQSENGETLPGTVWTVL